MTRPNKSSFGRPMTSTELLRRLEKAHTTKTLELDAAREEIARLQAEVIRLQAEVIRLRGTIRHMTEIES